MGVAGGGADAWRKRTRAADKGDLFDVLPDELVAAVLCKLSASAARPADLVAVFVVYAFFLIFSVSPNDIVAFAEEIGVLFLDLADVRDSIVLDLILWFSGGHRRSRSP